MSGDSSLNGDSAGSKELEYIFVRNKKNIVKFSDSIDYKPSSWTKNIWCALKVNEKYKIVFITL